MSLSNNTIRIIVAVFAIPVLIAVTFLGGYFFFLFVLGIALLSYYEFYKFTKNKGANINLWLGFVAIVFVLLNHFRPFFDEYSFYIFFIVLLSLTELFRNKDSAILNLGVTLLGIFYLSLFASALIELREFYPRIGDLYTRGGYLVISILAAIWVCDSAAYWGGTSLGKHKLFPRVSPNKSWEGSVFGFVFAILAMILAKSIVLDFISWQGVIVIGIIVGTIGQLGDLFESLLKRDAGIKDSSNIIPGHGGILDRFDSLLYSAPVVLLFLKFFER